MEGSRRSGRRLLRPFELLARGCVAAGANWAAPAVARPPVQSQLMQDQNASCKLAPPPTQIAQPRYLSGATTNPPARGRVVEVMADPKCTRKWSESISSLAASNAAAATAWHSRVVVVELANCAEQSHTENCASPEALPLAKANTRAGSCIYSPPQQQQRWRRGALQPCCCRP